jgi:hypothetical protein
MEESDRGMNGREIRVGLPWAMIGMRALGCLLMVLGARHGWGIVVNLEVLAMSLMLPQWKNDVKTLGRAWEWRKAMLVE